MTHTRPAETTARRPSASEAVTWTPEGPWAGHVHPVAILDRPLWWHRRGLSQTASGYGSRLTSPRVAVLPGGHHRRIYVTRWANAGTAWVVVARERVLLRETISSLQTPVRPDR